MIPASANPLLLRSAATQYQVSRSLRFNSADSAHLSRTPASAGSKKWTIAFWVKRAAPFTTTQRILYVSSGGTEEGLYFNNLDKLEFYAFSGGFQYIKQTARVFRDFAAWYHIVCIKDPDNATAEDRNIVYVNGVRETTFSNSTNMPSGYTGVVNTSVLHKISNNASDTLNGYLAEIHFIDGQALTPSSFTEVSATTGQLVPKQYSGSYGTNGFKLDFADNSAATAAALGKDTSGNGNNWTPNNFAINNSTLNYSSYWAAGGNNNAAIGANNAFDGNTSTYLRTNNSGNYQIWTPANSIAYTSLRIYVHNIVGTAANTLFVNGVAQTTPTSTGWFTPSGVSSPLTSIEIRETSTTALGIAAVEINNGILLDRSWPGNDSLVDTPTSYGTDDGLGGSVRGNFCTWNPLANSSTLANGNLDCSNSAAGWQTALSTIALSSGKWYTELTLTTHSVTNSGIHFGIAATSYSPASGNYLGNTATSYAYRSNIGEATGSKVNNNSFATYGAVCAQGDVVGLAVDLDAGTLTFYKNGVSQGQAFSGITGTFVIALSVYSAAGSLNFGQRPWAYTPPANYRPLVDTLLPAPVIAKPNTAFDATLWTGSNIANARTISGLQLSPDLVWIKNRTAAYGHQLFDAVRGTTRALQSNTTGAELVNDVAGTLSAFNSDGFTTSPITNNSSFNDPAHAYVAWCWDAGSSTVTNTQGSITSSVRANASAGFSIVTYTGNGSNATVGHGLGATPGLVIVKTRNTTRDWIIWTTGFTTAEYLLFTTVAKQTFSNQWGSLPTSSVFGVWDGTVNQSGNTFVAYCWAPVSGYSSAFSFTGNGSTDGPAVWLGFRPKLLIVKRTDTTGNWTMKDSSRPTYNVNNLNLFSNLSNAETTEYEVDFLSNGFKIRNTWSDWNANGGTYVGFAWAENPFAYARAR